MWATLSKRLERLPLGAEITATLDAQERRLVVRSLVIGAVVWAIVTALKKAVHGSFHATLAVVDALPSEAFIVAPLIVGSLLMAVACRYGAHRIRYRDDAGSVHELTDVQGDGLERAIALYYTSEPTLERALLGRAGVEMRWELPTFGLAFRKFYATLVTLGSGGSGGLEASVTLIGESTAAGLFKPRGRLASPRLAALWDWWVCADPDDLQTAQLGGIAAAVSTLLGAPFAAAFFATEVMYRRRPVIGKLVYSLIPALVAFFLTHVYGGDEPIFSTSGVSAPPFTTAYYGALIAMAFCIALVGFAFTKLRAAATRRFDRMRNIWLRHVTGACLAGGVAVAAGSSIGADLELVLGPGEAAIEAAFAGQLALRTAAVLLGAKMVATLATIGSGGSAGLLIPATYFGAMTGVATAHVFGIEPTVLVIPSITASLISIVNVPLAAILIVVELFGKSYMVPALIVLVSASIFSNRVNIYRTQREHYDAREILPGCSVRRVAVPRAWDGQTLAGLEVRRRFEITVIGIIEKSSADRQALTLDPSPTRPLAAGDLLVVLGRDERLDALGRAMARSERETPSQSGGSVLVR